MEFGFFNNLHGGDGGGRDGSEGIRICEEHNRRREDCGGHDVHHHGSFQGCFWVQFQEDWLEHRA